MEIMLLQYRHVAPKVEKVQLRRQTTGGKGMIKSAKGPRGAQFMPISGAKTKSTPL